MGRHASNESSFWARVSRDPLGCWIYEGRSANSYGHKKFSLYNRGMSAHRYSWSVVNGPIPEGLCVLHSCDNPGCVRPSHLFLGTPRDNTHDARAKGRLAHGSRHPHAKLTEEIAHEIKERLARGESNKEIAQQMGIAYWHVSNVKYQGLWRHA